VQARIVTFVRERSSTGRWHECQRFNQLSSSIRSFRKLTLRTGRWHECQCCNYQATPVGRPSNRIAHGAFQRDFSKHTHQLLVGSPCLHYCNTKPSLPRTSPPSNLRNQHCNRKAWRKSHSHRLDSDSPCRALCSTTPSLPLTSPPSNLRNHRRNCKDRQARQAAELAG